MSRKAQPEIHDYDEGKIVGLESAFAVVLRRLRKQRKLSQQALADLSGLGRPFVSLLERSLRRPSLSTVFQVAKPLGVSPTEFVAQVEDELTHSRR